ncbi:hypothetical protein PGTUg99_020362 [Puccinia graminis f. sp. tritici]|uniref:Uncharacterized protein n=2 Tax=Puccinia graminis f. sp. tritici TaxID=56615 RepID=A0A5B0NHE2_PUCGR|nr:hypothetical protein PGTUg99_020362 [Puccinia graminis f. sp. tritici]
MIVASANEELCGYLWDSALSQSSASDFNQHINNLQKPASNLNPGFYDLLTSSQLNSHERHPEASGIPESRLADFPESARRPPISHNVNSYTASPLAYWEPQPTSFNFFQKGFPMNELITNNPLAQDISTRQHYEFNMHSSGQSYGPWANPAFGVMNDPGDSKLKAFLISQTGSLPSPSESFRHRDGNQNGPLNPDFSTCDSTYFPVHKNYHVNSPMAYLGIQASSNHHSTQKPPEDGNLNGDEGTILKPIQDAQKGKKRKMCEPTENLQASIGQSDKTYFQESGGIVRSSIELNDNLGKGIWGEGQLDELQNLINSFINPETRDDEISVEKIINPIPTQEIPPETTVKTTQHLENSIMNTPISKHFGRLCLMDIINCEGIPQPYKDTLEQISILKNSEVESKNEAVKFRRCCKFLMKRYRHSKSVQACDYKLIHKIDDFVKDIDVWYNYWEKEIKIDIRDEAQLYRSPLSLPLFLFYVEMMIVISPWPLTQQAQENNYKGLDYKEELEKAVHFFQRFRADLIELDSNPEVDEDQNEEWKEYKDLIQRHTNFSQQRQYTISVLWHTLELWMKTNPTSTLWQNLSEYHGKNLNRNLKNFFNNIFFYGVENLTEHLKKNYGN